MLYTGASIMKNKITIICILTVFMLLTISFATAVNTNAKTNKKESPLFQIRTQGAIKDNIKEGKEKISDMITSFINNRVYLRIPLLEYMLGKGQNQNHLWSSPSGTFCPSMGCLTYCGPKC